MDDTYLFSIQKKIGYTAAIICFLLVILNIINYFNQIHLLEISILLVIGIIFSCTALIKKRAMMLIQVCMFLLAGTITIILEPAAYTGEILFITSFLLAYQYRFYRKFWWLQITFLIVYVIVLKLATIQFSINNAINSAAYIIFSIAFITIIILIFHEELNQYISTIKENEIFVRLGLNYAGLVHALDYKRSMKYITLVRRRINKNEIDKAHEVLDKLTDFINQQDRMRANILAATKMNKLTKKQPVHINEVIRSVVAVYKTDLILSKKIIFILELSEKDIMINAVPFEMFTMFQNIIQNVVDISNITKKPVSLTIRSEKVDKTISILFTDNGPGFRDFKQGESINIEKITSQKIVEGFGLEYILKTVKENEGKIELTNNSKGGACVKIQFITS